MELFIGDQVGDIANMRRQTRFRRQKMHALAKAGQRLTDDRVAETLEQLRDTAPLPSAPKRSMHDQDRRQLPSLLSSPSRLGGSSITFLTGLLAAMSWPQSR